MGARVAEEAALSAPKTEPRSEWRRSKGPRQRDRDDPRLALFAQPGLSLRALEIFVAVAKAGTMVAAAKDLKLTQPAVSQAIAGLEAALGVELFDRSLRPPTMTLLASALIADATRISPTRARRIQNKVRLQTATPVPHLRVGMPEQLRDLASALMCSGGFAISSTDGRSIPASPPAASRISSIATSIS